MSLFPSQHNSGHYRDFCLLFESKMNTLTTAGVRLLSAAPFLPQPISAEGVCNNLMLRLFPANPIQFIFQQTILLSNSSNVLLILVIADHCEEAGPD